MTSSNKAALKAAKAALDSHQYEDAVKEARKVLNGDPKHYHANIFLGLALEKQGQFEEAETAYQLALQSKDDDTLVWQGLIGLYERQANKKIDAYAKAARRLGELWMEADDKHRCQSVVDKYVGFTKQHGTKDQYRQALELMLPTSILYDFLEGRLPHPSQTYPKIVEIVESEEKQRINRLIGERRTRLGARIGQVTTDVKREVYENSPLEDLYNAIVNWTNDDDLRRLYEEKLLQRAYDVLTALPPAEKREKRQQVQELAEGLVILKHPFHLAWKIVLEWKDVERIGQLDVTLLREYIELFPTDGLSKVLNGYLESDISPFPKAPPKERSSEDEDEEPSSATEEDRIIAMTEGLEESSRSLLSQRLMAEFYLHLEEYSNAVENATKSKELIRLEREIAGLDFQNNVDAVNVILGTALVQHQSPRHHKEARELFEEILTRKQSDVSALIGVGLILEEEEEYVRAVEFLTRALETSPDVKVRAERAWCRALAGDYNSGMEELESCLNDIAASEAQDKQLKAQVLYRIGICLWNIDTSKASRKDRSGAYARFIASLQANMNYAPAYTSLGIYYSDYAKDRKRARKCFQKAFESSASEVEAAERLARSFADNSEWDLVELVSQRVVDSGKVRPPPGSKNKGLSWPLAALGVCQLNEQDYGSSVVSFQAALRINPDDYNSWVGLGESYHNSGRFIAATKAFEQAQKLQGQALGSSLEDAWFSRYMLANVRRELGEYENAVQSLEAVLSVKPLELGVSIALLQTHVESAWRNIELGLLGSALGDASKAIHIARSIVPERFDSFNLWKAVGDACSMFSWMEANVSLLPTTELTNVLQTEATDDNYSILSETDNIEKKDIDSLAGQPLSLSTALNGAILAHKRAIFCSASDIHAQAVAWYNLGWIEYRAYVCTDDQLSKAAKKQATAYLKAAVRCFKRAIELEAGNSEFWNSLGIVTTTLNPKVAQHAFIRSLYLNDKSARVWTNLGAFYLLQNDTELANEAFSRGQTSDPEYAHAWLGQGILALLLGDAGEAQSLFTHAFEISDSSSMVTKRLYTTSTFDQILSSRGLAGNLSDLLQPTFALQQLKSQAASDIPFHHLSSLFQERAGSHTEPISTLNLVCSTVEAAYELSESATDLAHFVQAKADLARAYLAVEDFPSAISNAETALALSEPDGEEEENGDELNAFLNAFRLSAHLTAGLAHHYSHSTASALPFFRSALEESKDSPDAVCLLAQVLWTEGGSEEHAVARDQLFDAIEQHPDHAGCICLLAAIALLDGDAATLDAVRDDLHSLRSREDSVGPDVKAKVGTLLAAIAAQARSSDSGDDKKGDDGGRGDETVTGRMVAEAQTAAMLEPAQPFGWSRLAAAAAAASAPSSASALPQESEAEAEDGAAPPPSASSSLFPAEMALLAARGQVPPRGALEAQALAGAYAGTGRLADAQRGIMVAPWAGMGWEGLVVG